MLKMYSLELKEEIPSARIESVSFTNHTW